MSKIPDKAQLAQIMGHLHWCNKIGADCEDDYFSFVFDGEEAPQ